MADADAKVLAAIEKALKKNPAASNAELREIAEKISSSVKKLTPRQFHALYPLRVKRLMAAGGTAKKGGAKKKAAAKKKRAATRKKTTAKKTTARKSARKSAAKRTRGAAKKRSAGTAASRIRTALAKRTASDDGKAPHTDAVRDVFLKFASDLTAAESRNDLVKVLANVDRYVQKAVSAMS